MSAVLRRPSLLQRAWSALVVRPLCRWYVGYQLRSTRGYRKGLERELANRTLELAEYRKKEAALAITYSDFGGEIPKD